MTCPHCGRPPGLHAKLTVSLDDYPRQLAALRREIGAVLREEAEGEPQVVRDFAARAAAEIEAGLRWEPEG